MTIVEKAAYLKGLTEGLGIEADSKEGKLWGALCELVSDMAHEIEDLQATSLDYADALDEVTEDLSYLEDLTCDLDTFDEDEWDDDEDEDNVIHYGDACCGRCFGASDEEFSSDDDDEDDEELEYDGVLYDVTCPTCGEEITFEESTLSAGSIACPNCGEELEFELDLAEEENEDEDK